MASKEPKPPTWLEWAKDRGEDALAGGAGVAQGLTFGWGDEFLGMVSEDAEAAYDQLLDDNPLIAFTGELGAGFVPFLGWANKAAQGAKIARTAADKARTGIGWTSKGWSAAPKAKFDPKPPGKLRDWVNKKVDRHVPAEGARRSGLRNVGAGSVYGGAYGLGEGEGGLADRFMGGLYGAGLGSAGSLLAPAIRQFGNAGRSAAHRLRKRNRGVGEIDPAVPLGFQGNNRSALSEFAKRMGARQFEELDAAGKKTGAQTDAVTTVEGLERAASAGNKLRAGSDVGNVAELYPFVTSAGVSAAKKLELESAVKRIDRRNLPEVRDAARRDPGMLQHFGNLLDAFKVERSDKNLKKLIDAAVEERWGRAASLEDFRLGKKMRAMFPDMDGSHLNRKRGEQVMTQKQANDYRVWEAVQEMDGRMSEKGPLKEVIAKIRRKAFPPQSPTTRQGPETARTAQEVVEGLGVQAPVPHRVDAGPPRISGATRCAEG